MKSNNFLAGSGPFPANQEVPAPHQGSVCKAEDWGPSPYHGQTEQIPLLSTDQIIPRLPQAEK